MFTAAQRTALCNEFSQLEAAATAVIDQSEGRDLTDAETAENEARFSRMRGISETIADRDRFKSLTDSYRASGEKLKAAQAGKPSADVEPRPAVAPPVIFSNGPPSKALIRTALNSWAANGHVPDQYATVISTTSNSAMFPVSIGPSIVPGRSAVFNVFREAITRAGMATIETPLTDKLKVPALDTSAGSKCAETAVGDSENPPSLAESVVLEPNAYQSGSVWFSDVLLATGFDTVAFVDNDLVPAKESALEADIAATIIADALVTQVATTGSATALSFADLDALNRALPGRYRRGRTMFLSPTAFDAAENLVDSTGRPMLSRDPINPEHLRFRGTLVMPCDSFQTLATGHTIGAIVSMVGFRIRDVTRPNVSRMSSIPGRTGQTGFNLIAFHGFGYPPSAVAKLKTP